MSVIEIPIAVFNTDGKPSQRHPDIGDNNSLVQFMKELYDEYLVKTRFSGHKILRLMSSSEITAQPVKDELLRQLKFQHYQGNKEVTSFFDFPLFRPDLVIKEERYDGIVLSVNSSTDNNGNEKINVLLVSVHMDYKKTEQYRKGELEKLKGKIDKIKCNGQFQVAHVIIAGDFNIGLGTIRKVFPDEEYNYATDKRTTAGGNSYDNIITSRSVRISDAEVHGKNTKVDKYFEFRQIFLQLCQISKRVQKPTLKAVKVSLLSQLMENKINFSRRETFEIQEFESYHEKGMKLCKSFECCERFQQLVSDILPPLASYNPNQEKYAICKIKNKLKIWLEECPSLDSCDKESLPEEIITCINLCMRLKDENVETRYKFSHFPLFAKLQVDLKETLPARSDEAEGIVPLQEQLAAMKLSRN